MTRGFVAALAAVSITGCMTDDFDGVDDTPEAAGANEPEVAGPRESLPPAVAGPCAQHATLVGLSETDPTAGRITLPDTVFDTDGSTICLTLDATTNIWIAHFWATAKHEPGDYSSFQLTLFDSNGNHLREGWDVTFGSSEPTTHASLEAGFDAGAVYEVKLHIRARQGQASTDLDIALFEPFE